MIYTVYDIPYIEDHLFVPNVTIIGLGKDTQVGPLNGINEVCITP